MKKFVIALGAVAALTASISAHAAQTITGKITQLQSYPTSSLLVDLDSPTARDYLYFKVTGTTAGTLASCITPANAGWFMIATGESEGTLTHSVSLIEQAYLQGKSVVVTGSPACNAKGELATRITLQ